MEEPLSIESFAAELAQSDKPEQSAAADSDPGQQQDAGDGSSREDASQKQPEAQAEGDAEGEQSEQPPEGSGAEDRLHKWTTANGDTYEVPESDLRAGYLRTQDYTRKMQDGAEQVRQAMAQTQQHLQGQVGLLNQIQQGLMFMGGLDAQIRALQSQNLPTADLQVQRMRAEQQMQAAISQVAQSHDQQSKAQKQGAVSASEQHLAAKFPGITPKDVEDVFRHVSKLSPSESEIELIRTNPRLAELAIYAGKWLDLQAKKPEVQNKVRKLPPAVTNPRQSAPTSKTDAALRAINSRRSFSTAEFAELLKATG